MTNHVGADRRLGPYTVLAVAGLLAALVTGEAAFAAVAAPAAVLVAWALADRRPIVVDVSAVRAPARLLEGDDWTLAIDLRWTGPAEIDVLHTGLRGSVVQEPGGWVVRADGAADLELRAVAERWGRHGLGAVVVRARRPGGMLVWDTTIELDGAVRILPDAPRLAELLRPDRPRVAAGVHPSPVRAPGTDFADLRPYAPGDRLRDLSWTASARSDQPWVVVHHPERTATVVILLDAFVDAGVPLGALDRAARVVWSIARRHLAAGDRVGLLSLGAAAVWLPPRAGRRAQWMVLDALLSVGSTVTGSDRPARAPRRRHAAAPVLPADSVVVGVSPLQSDAFVAAVGHHCRLGRPTAVVGVATADLLEPPLDDVERAARRLWDVDTDMRRARLGDAGVPSVVAIDDAASAVSRLLARRPRSGRRAAGRGAA